MLAQPGAEVIVVDFSCPQGTGGHVREHFATARVVAVEGQSRFSNWSARNAGAAAATGDLLVFCDADTILAPGALAWLDANLPPRSFGVFTREATGKFNKTGLRIASNQLKGFQVIPAAAFRRLGGYDEVLRGWGAGGDTDLEERLALLGLRAFPLDPTIIDDVVQHDNAERLKHHDQPIRTSYAAGLLYRAAKIATLKLNRRVNLPLAIREKLYQTAHATAQKLGDQHDRASVTVTIDTRAVGMPLQLGYRKAECTLSVRVELRGTERIDEIPER
jgi:glycosyltransferase involved in cell wall biosynthesis